MGSACIIFISGKQKQEKSWHTLNEYPHVKLYVGEREKNEKFATLKQIFQFMVTLYLVKKKIWIPNKMNKLMYLKALVGSWSYSVDFFFLLLILFSIRFHHYYSWQDKTNSPLTTHMMLELIHQIPEIVDGKTKISRKITYANQCLFSD